MSCNCTTGMNAKLAEHNTRLVETFGFPRDGRPAYTRPKIDTEKIEPRKRVGPALAIPSFCPFCGEPYEPQPARSAASVEAEIADRKFRELVSRCEDETAARLGDLVDRFRGAVSRIPYIAEALEKGQQFNCYQRAFDDDDDNDVDHEGDGEDLEFRLCIGPITDARLLVDINGRNLSDLFEAAFKIAALAAVPAKGDGQ